MKTLIICHQYLDGHGGGVYAARAYINAFAALSERTTLLYPYAPGHEAEGIVAGVEMVPVGYDKPKALKGLDLLRGRIHRFYDVAREYADASRYDVVVFSGSLCSFKIIDAFKAAGIKCIVLHHNYEVEYFRDNTPAALRPTMLHWVRKCEGEAVRKSDLNLTLTSADARLLSEHYSERARFRVSGVFEPFARELPLAQERAFEGKYLITGNLSAVQTERSLARWFSEYFPSLQRSEGFTSLTLAGKNPGPGLLSLCAGLGVEVVANPETMDGVLSAADCYLCPVSLGGGLKLRNMDGLRFGLPVITHRVSARGYEAFLGSAMFSYGDVEGFEAALKEIRKHPLPKAEIRSLYEKEFSWESGLARLGEMVKEYFTPLPSN